MIEDIIKTLRVNHYIKNFVVIVPLIFSAHFLDFGLWLKIFEMFLSFCAVSSAVYILNDLIDIENDKLHPVKRNRPIPSGKISKQHAIMLMIVLIAFSLIVSVYVNPTCFIFVSAYFILNVLYSFWLKNILLLDVFCIAIGFILRVITGYYAINIVPPALVLIVTFFVSIFFTFMKRKLELNVLSDNFQYRKSAKVFDKSTLDKFILISAILSILIYLAYVLDKTAILLAGTSYLFITVLPFVLLFFRLLFLTNSSKDEYDPLMLIKNDKIMKLLFLFYLITSIAVMMR